MPTPAEIRNRALKKLGVLSQGQVADDEYANDLDQAYLEVYAELDTMGLVDWDSDEDIPNVYANPVVALTAYARVDEYGIPTERRQRIAADAGASYNRLRELQESDVFNRALHPPKDY